MLTFKDLGFAFKSRKLFNNLEFTCGSGFYKLIGDNGSGKSTLLKLINGDIFSNKVNIDIDEFSYQKHTKSEIETFAFNNISFLSNNLLLSSFTFNENLKILEHIDFDKNKIDYLVDLLDLKYIVKRKIASLSGGERKKLNLIFALAKNVNYYFLDEPFAELDYESVQVFAHYIKNNYSNKTVIIVDHDNLVEYHYTGEINLNNFEYKCELNNLDDNYLIIDKTVHHHGNSKLILHQHLQDKIHTIINYATSFIFILICFLTGMFMYRDYQSFVPAISENEVNDYLPTSLTFDAETDVVSSLIDSNYDGFLAISLHTYAIQNNFYYNNELNIPTDTDIILVIDNSISDDKFHYFPNGDSLIDIDQSNIYIDNRLCLGDDLLKKKFSLDTTVSSSSLGLMAYQRYDYIYCNYQSSFDFINGNYLSLIVNNEGQKLLTDNLNTVDVSFDGNKSSYHLSLTLKENFVSLGTTKAGTNISFSFGMPQPTDSELITTIDGSDENKFILSYDLFWYLRLFDARNAMMFTNKTYQTNNILGNYQIEQTSYLLNNYEDIEQVLFNDTITLVPVLICYFVIYIIFIIAYNKRNKNEERSELQLKNLGYNFRQRYFIRSSTFLIPLILFTLTGVILTFFANDFMNLYAYKACFMQPTFNGYHIEIKGHIISSYYDSILSPISIYQTYPIYTLLFVLVGGLFPLMVNLIIYNVKKEVK